MNTLESQKAEIAKLQADLVAAQALNTEAQTQITTLTSERDAALSRASQADLALATANGSVNTLTATITTLTGERDQLKADAYSVEEKAQRMVATLGHSPLTITPNADEATGEKAKSLLAKFESLTGAERTEFWNENKAQLIREQQKQGKS